ncbi:MAG: ATP-dependent helicase, partial [Pirellulaceae bacterium]
AVDFDDLLLCTEELFQEHHDALREEAGRFDHLLVDEYQDTNGSQYRIVKALASAHRNLCVVGDDDQSIYAWRGAEVEHILRFSRDWPDAKVVRLEENYRSTAEILEMANRLIAFNKTRHDKTLRAARRGGEKPRVEQYRDETAEAEAVVADIARHLSRKEWEPRDFAILCRTNEQPRVLEAELRRADLPYVLIGTSSFFDRKEVRDVLAYLKVLSSPQDEVALLRIINTPPRGIGARTVEQLMQHAVQGDQSVWQVMQTADRSLELPDKPRRAVQSLVSFVRRCRGRVKGESLVGLARSMLDEIRYEDELRRIYENETERQARWGTVEELLNAIGAYESRGGPRSLKGFLDETALAGNDFDNEKEKQLQRNAIALLTLHSAKGLEFPHVYMVGMEEGLLPHRKSVEMEGAAIEEERRLCYVGVTRAQERLTLSMALTRRKWGKPRETVPSRFLFELIGLADPPHPATATRRRGQSGSPTSSARGSRPRRNARP